MLAAHCVGHQVAAALPSSAVAHHHLAPGHLAPGPLAHEAHAHLLPLASTGLLVVAAVGMALAVLARRHLAGGTPSATTFAVLQLVACVALETATLVANAGATSADSLKGLVIGLALQVPAAILLARVCRSVARLVRQLRTGVAPRLVLGSLPPQWAAVRVVLRPLSTIVVATAPRGPPVGTMSPI